MAPRSAADDVGFDRAFPADPGDSAMTRLGVERRRAPRHETIVQAVLVPRPVGGASLFAAEAGPTRATISAYRARLDDARAAAEGLLDHGFRIDHFHDLVMSFSGSVELFRSRFGLRLDGHADSSLEAEDVARLQDLPAWLRLAADGVALACPPDRQGALPTAAAPAVTPHDTAGGTPFDARGSGGGLVVALLGSGLERHGVLAERRHMLLPTLLGPGQRSPLLDATGAGTRAAAALLDRAPAIRLRPLKGLLDPAGDLNVALESTPRPAVLALDWGYDPERRDAHRTRYLRTLEVVLANVTAHGVLLCAERVHDQPGAPALHPDVVTDDADAGTHSLGELAGRLALLLERTPGLTPEQCRTRLGADDDQTWAAAA
jgi:hypothetical protein